MAQADYIDLPTGALSALLPYGRRRRFRVEEELMREGEPSDVMYLILSGRVRVTRSHQALAEPLPMAILGPGEVVGEMGLLEKAPRSATVRAMEDLISIELDADAVTRCILEHPDLSLALLGVLSRRLRTTDELVARIEAERQGAAKERGTAS